MALAAALFGFTDFVGDARIRHISDARQHLIGNLVAVVLALINWFIRYKCRGGRLFLGFWISLITVLLLAFNGWKGWELVYRRFSPQRRIADPGKNGQGADGVRQIPRSLLCALKCNARVADAAGDARENARPFRVAPSTHEVF